MKVKKIILCFLSALLLFSGLFHAASFADEDTKTVIFDDGLPTDTAFCVPGDRLCYHSAEGIISCALDGTDRKIVSAKTGTLFSDGKELFLGSQSEIIRIADDGEEELLLRVYPLVNEGAFAIMNTMSHFAARDGVVYYVLTMAQDYELWKVSTEDGSNQRVCSICPPDCEILEMSLRENADGIFIRYRNQDSTGCTLLYVSE